MNFKTLKTVNIGLAVLVLIQIVAVSRLNREYAELRRAEKIIAMQLTDIHAQLHEMAMRVQSLPPDPAVMLKRFCDNPPCLVEGSILDTQWIVKNDHHTVTFPACDHDAQGNIISNEKCSVRKEVLNGK